MTLREFAAATALGAVIMRIDNVIKKRALEAAKGDPDDAARRMYEDAALSAVGFADALIERLEATRGRG
jgi:hypothetical protein